MSLAVTLTERVFQAPVQFWGVLAEMAPYLLFGFLMAGVLSVVISPQTVERHLGGGGVLPIFKASAFGVPLPLCSCGVIPVGASLRRHGAGNGPTVAFLISTPQTGVDSVMVTFSLLGPVFAVFRPLFALVSGIAGGLAVEAVTRPEDAKVAEGLRCEGDCCAVGGRRSHRTVSMLRHGFVTLPRDIGRALLAGLVVAAILATAIPENFFVEHLGRGVVAILVMMALGIPVYVCATASIPIALALIHAGATPGAALAFLMTGPATNAATIATIWKLMGRRTAIVYLLAVAVAALCGGVALDAIYNSLDPSWLPQMPEHVHRATAWGIAKTISAVVLLAVLAHALVRPSLGHLAPLRGGGRDHKGDGAREHGENVELIVTGMTCSHCRSTVERGLAEVPGVESVRVDLDSGLAVVHGCGLDAAKLVMTVEELGYSARPKQA